MRRLHTRRVSRRLRGIPGIFFDIVKGTPALNLINARPAAVYNIGIPAGRTTGFSTNGCRTGVRVTSRRRSLRSANRCLFPTVLAIILFNVMCCVSFHWHLRYAVRVSATNRWKLLQWREAYTSQNSLILWLSMTEVSIHSNKNIYTGAIRSG